MVLRKSLSICIAILICFTTLVFPATNTKKSGFITLALENVLESMNGEDYINVGVFIEEIDVDQLEADLLKDIGVNRELIASEESGDELTIEAVQRYVQEERSRYSVAQLDLNDHTLKEILEMIPCEDYYISSYSPCIFLRIKKEDLAKIQKIDHILEVDYFPTLSFEDCGPVADPTLPDPDDLIPMNDYFEIIGATQMRDTYGYTGEGIKIGQIESGVPDTSKACFTGASINIKTGCNNTTVHASQVASILVSQQIDAKGMVPDASLYCAQLSATIPATFCSQTLESIEWLINQGCNIINMSASDKASNHGLYNAYSKWIDHIAINHSVHFVVSSGNKSGFTYPLRVPYTSMGYNCVTVGNINGSGWVDTSRYQEVSSYADKPDISCFGENVVFPTGLDYNSGTSFSTPMVTGVLAQLCDYKASLLALQDRAKADICASIPYTNLMYVTDTNSYHKSGAGLISSTSSRYTIARGFSKESYFSANDTVGTYKSYSFTLTNDTISRVCLTWLKYNKFTSTCSTTFGASPDVDAGLANLDLYVYDSNGTPVTSSILTSGNMEIIQFTPVMNETYTVRVVLTETSTQKTYFGLAWW